jgi:hypothetical protein
MPDEDNEPVRETVNVMCYVKDYNTDFDNVEEEKKLDRLRVLAGSIRVRLVDWLRTPKNERMRRKLAEDVRKIAYSLADWADDFGGR